MIISRVWLKLLRFTRQVIIMLHNLDVFLGCYVDEIRTYFYRLYINLGTVHLFHILWLGI